MPIQSLYFYLILSTSNIKNIRQRKIGSGCKSVHVGSFHAMASVHRHAEKTDLKVISASHRRARIASIAEEQIDGIVALRLLRILNESARQLVKFDLMHVDLTPDSKLIVRIIKNILYPIICSLKTIRLC